MGKWEYKVESYDGTIDNDTDLQELLDEYGEQGYELVNVIPQYASSSNVDSVMEDIFIMHQVLIFKRSIEE